MKKFDVLLDARYSCTSDIFNILATLRKNGNFGTLIIVSFSNEFIAEKNVRLYRNLKLAVQDLAKDRKVFICRSGYKETFKDSAVDAVTGLKGIWVETPDLEESAEKDRILNIIPRLSRTLPSKDKLLTNQKRKKVLYVSHTEIKHVVGGVQFHINSLVKLAVQIYDVYVLFRSGKQLILQSYNQSREFRFEFEVNAGSNANEFNNIEIENEFNLICTKFKFDVIHFHHLLGLPWALFNVAKKHSNKVLFTIHDYYVFCQRYDLIDSTGKYCGFSKSEKKCTSCLSTTNVSEHYVLDLKNANFSTRRSRIKKVLDGVSLIVPSRDVLNNLVQNMKFSPKSFDLIEHPIKKPEFNKIFNVKKNEMIGLAFVGNFSTKKGSEIFLKIVSEWDQKRIPVNWNVFGRVTDVDLADELMQKYKVKFHGHYDVKDLPMLFQTHHIQIGLLLSIWPETFSYALNDILDSGAVPISTDIGAPADRIRQGGFGWTIDLENPTENLAKIILKVLDKPNIIKQKSLNIPKENYFKQMAELFQEYGGV